MTNTRPSRPAHPHRPRGPLAAEHSKTRTEWDDALRQAFALAYPQRYIVGLGQPAPATPATLKRGDKVEIVTVTVGYVDDVKGDDVIVVDRRTPFKGEAQFVGSGPYASTAVRVIEPAPAAPKVGDVITGATLKATPWKRGTQITLAGTSRVVSHVLGADGKWTNVDYGTRYGFDQFPRESLWRVDNAPGK